MVQQGDIFGFGNPLLDIISNVDQAFLDKYEIKLNDQILAEDKHQPLFKELASRSDVQYVPGGATQNAMRYAQWFLNKPKVCSYTGCVGDDQFQKDMKQISEDIGIEIAYAVDSSTPTGTCGVCVNGGERSLVTNLGAANNYKVDYLKDSKRWSLLEKSKLAYMEGFFCTVSQETIEAVAKHCSDNNKMFGINVSAQFIVQVPPFRATFELALHHADYVFGNEIEFGSFAEVKGWQTKDLVEVAKKISQLPTPNSGRVRTVIITQGAQPTICARGDKVDLYPVIHLKKEDLIDTNGAGDAFVGGFISGLIQGQDTKQCCAAGNYCANKVIQLVGAATPKDTSNFQFEQQKELQYA